MKQKGFTLIELLVVIAIIGLLASIVLVALNGARIKSRDAKRRSDLQQLQTAINLYYNDNLYLPRNQSGWCTYISDTNNGYGAAFQADLSPKYVGKVPLDPSKANQAGDYYYSNDDNTNGKFTLCATLEQPTSSDVATDTNHSLIGCSNWPSTYNYCISQ